MSKLKMKRKQTIQSILLLVTQLLNYKKPGWMRNIKGKLFQNKANLGAATTNLLDH